MPANTPVFSTFAPLSLRDDRRLARTRKSRQNAKNLDAEFLSFGAAEDRPRSSLHSRSKIFERKQFRSFWFAAAWAHGDARQQGDE